jgi:hypothetical protein
MKLKALIYLILFFWGNTIIAQKHPLLDTLEKVYKADYNDHYNCNHKKEKKRFRFCWNYEEYLVHDVIRKNKIDSLYHYFNDFNFNTADSIVIFETIADVGGFMSTTIAIDTVIYSVTRKGRDEKTKQYTSNWTKTTSSKLDTDTLKHPSLITNGMIYILKHLEEENWENRTDNDDYGILGGTHCWITKIIRLGPDKYKIKIDYIRN